MPINCNYNAFDSFVTPGLKSVALSYAADISRLREVELT